MKRIFDVVMSLLVFFLLSAPMILIALIVKVSSYGPVLYWSNRVGINNTIFKMPKYRTMRINAPQVATHLMKDPDQYLTAAGPFLRKFSLDELPQLWSILKGDMSFVGPRPALFNQDDLIKLRTEKGISQLTPGVTGWAQINGRDDLPIPEKVLFDEYYMQHQSFLFDIEILWKTLFKVINREGVVH
jgi:O-antigen biosynthesis protein WbqP